MEQVVAPSPASVAHLTDTGEPAAIAPFLGLVMQQKGRSREVMACSGENLMLVLNRAGFGLAAVCGGKGVCGTCRVAFPPEWAMRLAPPQKREQQLLCHLKTGVGERLSCRINLTAELNGLEVRACE
jgi:2Fe-2S ferredoxin